MGSEVTPSVAGSGEAETAEERRESVAKTTGRTVYFILKMEVLVQ